MASARVVLLLLALFGALIFFGGTDRTEAGGTICHDYFGGYNPTRFPSGCYSFARDNPDSMVTYGRVLLHDAFAPMATLVSAFVGSTECGRAATTYESQYVYVRLDINGAEAQEGCAAQGESVQLMVDEKDAGQIEYRRSTSGPAFVSFTAVEPFAWYWFDRNGYGVPNEGDEVQARIDGATCGTAVVSRGERGPFPYTPRTLVGFTRLIVPPAEITPGCGEDGATVEFILPGYGTLATAPWEPGLHEVDLGHAKDPQPGDVDCDSTVTSIDALLILQFDAGRISQLSVLCPEALDVDDTGDVTSLDAALVLQFVAGLFET